MSKRRVALFIDGFNVYHSIDEIGGRDDLKWLDFWSLGAALIHPQQESLVAGYYFSAFADWIKDDAKDRHRRYVQALKSRGIVAVMGQFKQKKRTCSQCRSISIGHEEKETDVNIALYLLDMAYRDTYDTAIVFTADTDIAPAIRMVKERFSQKTIIVAIPQRRLKHANALVHAADGRISLKDHHFSNNLLPERIDLSANQYILRPLRYAPLPSSHHRDI